ncbi:sugar phosphate isomerase/epimerase family protein [Mesorhizobium cantuariense]|uniref:Sugar phosphate isomerase/epimerase family protein n=1 Tax=Mesorhizobium cantuariense TaxID=1300275 RepID=A0ABV7MIF8_9HYPH
MRLLLHTMATPELTPVQALDRAMELRLDGLDLICQAGYRCAIAPDASLSEARALRAEAERRGVAIAALTPYEKRINSPDPHQRAEAVTALCHAVDLAEALGAASLRILAGEAVADREWQDRAAPMIEVLRAVSRHAAGKGIALNIENHDGTMADSAHRSAEIWRRVSAGNVGIVYDPANLIRDGKEGFPESLDLQRQAIGLVHVKDYRFTGDVTPSAANEAGRRSVPVGDGDIPWAGIIHALRDAGYAGDFSFEYEMRWVPEQLPPTRIGVARSRAHLLAIFGLWPAPQTEEQAPS